MDKQTGFLQASPGNFSSGRAAFLFWVVFSVVAWIWVYMDSHNATQALTTFVGIAGVATAHKGFQGMNENKAANETPPNGN